MAACRRAIALSLAEEDRAKLKLIARSRTEPANRVDRADIAGLSGRSVAFLRLAGRSDFIIRPLSAASSVP